MKTWLLILAFFAYTALFFLSLLLITLLVRFLTHRKKRKCWKMCLIGACILTVLTITAGAINARCIQVTNYDIVTEKNLSRSYTIAMISDVHYGTAVDADLLQEVCDEISAKNPDFVLLNGDIVDENTTEAELQEVFKILSGIKSVYGTWFTYGNHESMATTGQYGVTPSDPEIVEKALKENNIPVLADQSTAIGDEILLIGRLDYSLVKHGGTRADISQLTENSDQNKLIVLADHQPVELSKNAENGIDLMLSGHTHAGQIWPLGYPSELLGFAEMTYGWRQTGKMQTIVSSGAGVWGFPIRTAERSEYLIVTVHN